MKTHILNAIKWYVFAALCICGCYALIVADEYNTIKPTMISVFALGFAFIIGAVWQKLRGRILLISFIVILVAAVLAKYAPSIAAVYLGVFIDMHMLFLWLLLALCPGAPIMVYVFAKNS